MGAWALTLFSADYDLNLIGEFSDQAGLTELEAADGGRTMTNVSPAEQRQTDHKRASRGEDLGGTTIKGFPRALHTCDDEIKYSVYAKLCSNPERVRQHLDSGVIRRMMDQYSRELLEANTFWQTDAYGPGYQLILLGCCAMTLGAQLSQSDRDIMKAHYRSVHLMRDAVKQVEAALDPDTGYVNGVPWDFMTMPFGTTKNDEADLAFPGTGMINCIAPDHGRDEKEMAAFRRMCMPALVGSGPWGGGKPMTPEQLAKTMANLNFDPCQGQREDPVSAQFDAGWARYFPNWLCGFSGCRKGRDGVALLLCNKCKVTQYCSRDCQKAAWKHHKKDCQAKA